MNVRSFRPKVNRSPLYSGFMTTRRTILAGLAAAVALSTAAGCSGEDTSTETAPATSPVEAESETTAETAAGIRLIDVETAAGVLADQPDDLVVLDVRTPEEFASGHLDGAVMIDFHRADFKEQLAELDRDVPYLLYCRSGNRSGQTRALMADLGFADVADVDGGILAWAEAGQPIVGS